MVLIFTCYLETLLGTRELPINSCLKNATTHQSALVFDWGMRHIGVALITKSTHVAIPLKTLDAKRGQINHAQADELMRDHSPDVLVVGLPMNMDGSTSTETRHAQRLGLHLGNRYDLPVAYMDERLTTREAIERSENPNPDHSLAALVIAEAWLAEQTSQ